MIQEVAKIEEPQEFVFFKGINDAGNQGLLKATVDKGLPPGNYRLCSMSSASNHQPVLIPVAQRGAQDDCVRFVVINTGGNGRKNDKNKGGNKDKNARKVANDGQRAAKGNGGRN